MQIFDILWSTWEVVEYLEFFFLQNVPNDILAMDWANTRISEISAWPC